MIVNTYYIGNFVLTTAVVAAFAGALYYFYYYKPHHLATTGAATVASVTTDVPVVDVDMKKHTVLFDVLIVLLAVILLLLGGARARVIYKRRNTREKTVVPSKSVSKAVSVLEITKSDKWNNMAVELSKVRFGSPEWNKIIKEGNGENEDRTSKSRLAAYEIKLRLASANDVDAFNAIPDGDKAIANNYADKHGLDRKVVTEALLIRHLVNRRETYIDSMKKQADGIVSTLGEIFNDSTEDAIGTRKVLFMMGLSREWEESENKYHEVVEKLTGVEKEWFEELKQQIENANKTITAKKQGVSEEREWIKQLKRATSIKTAEQIFTNLERIATDRKLGTVEMLFNTPDGKRVIKEQREYTNTNTKKE